MASLDQFFFKRYDANSYNCAHFASEVWTHLTGQDISEALGCFLAPVRDRSAPMDLRRRWRRLKSPENPCILLMQRPRSVPHVGVYFNGRVIHIHERGVEFLPVEVATRGFTKLGFYK